MMAALNRLVKASTGATMWRRQKSPRSRYISHLKGYIAITLPINRLEEHFDIV